MGMHLVAPVAAPGRRCSRCAEPGSSAPPSLRRLLRAGASGLALLVLAACGGSGTPEAATGSTLATPADKQIQAVPVVAAAEVNGWYWNPAEGGTGFMFEAQGQAGFVAFFLYDEHSGTPVWYASQGSMAVAADGAHLFTGELMRYSGGQPLSRPDYRSPVGRSVGAVSIRFAAGATVVQLPGRTLRASRFLFGGQAGSTGPGEPEVGWYWNPLQGGRGYAIEVQNGRIFMALFHYDAVGEPTWHLIESGLEAGTANAALQFFRGGQSLQSAYRAPTGHSIEGWLRLNVDSPCANRIEIAGVASIPIQRFTFGDLPAGDECRAAAAASTDGLAVHSRSASLSWQPAPAPVIGYRVYHGTSSQRYDQPLGSGIFSPVPRLTWPGLTAGQVHHFAVTAVDAAGNESAHSNNASKAIP